ncbi:MAG: hypothetical protein WB689_13910 [Xanthobacteraceae bacterium]
MKTCPDCNGDGVIEKGTDDEQQCPTCGGSGFVPDDDDDDMHSTKMLKFGDLDWTYRISPEGRIRRA